MCNAISGRDNKRGIGYFVANDAAYIIKKLRKQKFMTDELPSFFHQLDTLGISLDDIKEPYEKYLHDK